MAVYYFPKDDHDFTGIVSYSPLDRIRCQEKPFGDVSAEEYLKFAKEDLSRKSRAGLVNALSNAKRCFHYHTDRLLFRFGLREATTKSRFPAKIDLLHDLKIVSGTLLRGFNRERNAMEHDYSAPTDEVAESSIDLCELFLLATERYLCQTPATLRIVMENDERDLMFQLEPGGNSIKNFHIIGTTLQETDNGKIYREPLFKLGTEELTEGISIQPLPGEDIPLRMGNKQQWLHILQMFSAAAHEGREPQYPNEPLAIIQHTVPWELVKKAFQAMRKVDTNPS